MDLSALVRETVGEGRPRVDAAGIELDCESPSTALNVKGDPIRLRQIIDNILSNAIKFTPEAGRIAVELRAEANFAILRIEDTGVGFEANLATQMFIPFVQLEQDAGRTHGGLGLGLAIAKNLAELHGGRLSGESLGLGHGATFTLTLPLQKMPAYVAVLKPSLLPNGKRVLVVEDNQDAAAALVELLGLMGCEVDLAHDGKSALALANAKRPDLILCDLGSPGDLDGFAVVRAARADEQLQNTRLVAVSGYGRPGDREKAKLAGFDEMVTKPITLKSSRN